jgi:hypothetical protein
MTAHVQIGCLVSSNLHSAMMMSIDVYYHCAWHLLLFPVLLVCLVCLAPFVLSFHLFRTISLLNFLYNK